MDQGYQKCLKLNPAAADTLQVVISTLLDHKIEAGSIADVLATSRTQVERWATGAHIPSKPAFRAWLVGELFNYIRKLPDTPGGAKIIPMVRRAGPSI